eukprot:10511676-Lingulodinium_polyedra.AAC.1
MGTTQVLPPRVRSCPLPGLLALGQLAEENLPRTGPAAACRGPAAQRALSLAPRIINQPPR